MRSFLAPVLGGANAFGFHTRTPLTFPGCIGNTQGPMRTRNICLVNWVCLVLRNHFGVVLNVHLGTQPLVSDFETHTRDQNQRCPFWRGKIGGRLGISDGPPGKNKLQAKPQFSCMSQVSPNWSLGLVVWAFEPLVKPPIQTTKLTANSQQNPSHACATYETCLRC